MNFDEFKKRFGLHWTKTNKPLPGDEELLKLFLSQVVAAEYTRECLERDRRTYKASLAQLQEPKPVGELPGEAWLAQQKELRKGVEKLRKTNGAAMNARQSGKTIMNYREALHAAGIQANFCASCDLAIVEKEGAICQDCLEPPETKSGPWGLE